MKKILIIFSLMLMMCMVNISSYAETKMVTASGGFDSLTFFSLEFYLDGSVLFTTSIPFTNMDPTSSHVMADGRAPYDGKNDTGLLCRINTGGIWYFKIQGTPTPPFTLDRIKYYLGQPWNRSYYNYLGPGHEWEGRAADGELEQPAAWYNIPSSSTVVYTAGERDGDNLPGGTLCLFSFAINPGQLDASQTYNCGITYTLSVDP